MAIQEIYRGVGTWSIQLGPDTPAELRDLFDEHRYGRIVVDAARDNPRLIGDALLRSARFVGALSSTSNDDVAGVALGGYGMGWWLGDADKKAATVFETAVQFSGAPFASVISTLCPPSLTVGSVTNPSGGGSYTGTHQWQSPRDAIDYVCDLFNCAWRVNGDATLDAGPTDTMFRGTPQAVIVPKVDGGDPVLRGLQGTAKLDRDMDDFSTRVVTLAEGQGSTVRVGTADILPGLNPYKDPQGNPVQWVRMVSESNTSLTNADARAQLQLNRFTSPRSALNLSTATHDISGDVQVGDQVWCYDPDAGLEDPDTQIQFRGDTIYPVKLQVTQLTWGVLDGMGVYFRDTDGGWWDLTDYVVWESDSATQVVVGDYNRSLTEQGTEPIGSRVVADTSVPDAPTLTLPFTSGVYQSASGFSRAKIVVAWSQPLNTDGTSIVDGQQYDIQYRTPAGTGDWSTMTVGFDQTQASILELLPATEYGIRVRAVDTANPPNFGAWTDEETVVSAGDTIPPATPAAPTVAGNPVSIQVIHTLGAAAGGTYNLDPDLHHLEVHASASGASFTPDASTKLGELAATQGMMSSTVPAIGTFTVPNTGALWVKVVAVDESGNRSSASAASSASATLIDSAHISDVVASLITTGNMTAVLALVGAIQTANSGARWRADSTGWKTYRPSGTLALWNDSSTGDLIGYAADGTTVTFRISASTGSASVTGTLNTTLDGSRVLVTPGSPADGLQTPGVAFWADNSDKSAFIYAVSRGNATTPTAINLASSLDPSTSRRGFGHLRDNSVSFGIAKAYPPTTGAPNGVLQLDGGSVASGPTDARLEMLTSTSTTTTSNGGFAVMTTDDGFLGHAGASGNNAYLEVNSTGDITGVSKGAAHFGITANGMYVEGRDGSGFEAGGGTSSIKCSGAAEVVSLDFTAWRPISASAFNVNSSAVLKEDFEELPGSALGALRNAPITRYRYRGGQPGETHVGPVAEDLPDWVKRPAARSRKRTRHRLVASTEFDDDGRRKSPPRAVVEEVPDQLPRSEQVDLMSWISTVAEALRELDAEVDELRRELGRPVPRRRTAAHLLSDIERGRFRKTDD